MKVTNQEADVCLILEGTYPYVRGGVSTWVHQIISSMPELTFSVYYVGWEKEQGAEYRYDLPPNLIQIKEAYLFGDQKAVTFIKNQPKELAPTLDFLDSLLVADEVPTESVMELLIDLSKLATKMSFEDVWKNKRSWQAIEDFYESKFAGQSFVDFFWNLKNLIHPVWRTLRCVDDVPVAKLYHSVCTGYSGLIGAVVSKIHNRPYLLSEHGIYVRERMKDILKREWAPKSLADEFLHPTDAGISPYAQIWIDFFLFSGNIAYESAEQIVSLFQNNKAIQVSFGAANDKVRIIPNGMNLERCENAYLSRQQRVASNRGNNDRVVVGFLGRVVSIKDVRMLIRGAAEVCRACPMAEFQIVGPTDEDEDYAAGCLALIEELGVASQVFMPGPVSEPLEVLSEFDIMVLSSVSEGLPFSVIEAFAMAMPVVSTRVGACEELIYGRDENPAIGAAGVVVPVGDYSAFAKALIPLINDPELRSQLGEAGRRRVETYYREEDVVADYKKIYVELAQHSSAQLVAN